MNIQKIATRTGACALLLCAVGCRDASGAGVQGNGVIKTEARDVGPFDAIELGGALKLELTSGPLAISISGDENILPLVKTRVSGRKLVVSEAEDVRTKAPIVLSIRAPGVTRIDADGAASVAARGIQAASFHLGTSGAAQAELSGSADQLEIDLGGAGSVRAGGLAAKNAHVTVSGAGSVEVNVSEKLKAEVSGVGSVRYHGTPAVEKSVSGLGSVTPVS